MERILSELEHYQTGRAQRNKENIHVVLWLVKDFAWLMHFKILGLVMAVPTVILAIILTVKSLMTLFDTYYKWLFYQVRHTLKEGGAMLRSQTAEVLPKQGSDLSNFDKQEKDLEWPNRIDDIDFKDFNFRDISELIESKGLLTNSKHRILRFLGYGDLGIENYAGLRTTVLNDVLSDYYHNLAVTCWIIGNVIWMVGEFFFDDTIRYVSVPFFGIGLAVIGWYYVFLRVKLKTKDSLKESSVKQ